MTPPGNSWHLELYDTLLLGKLEIRYGSKPHIWDCTTLPGNWPPKDMALSKLLRYYLHWLINSDFPPHGRYMTCSMLPFYLPITPQNHMDPHSHLCLLTSLMMKKNTKWKPSFPTRAPMPVDCTWPHGRVTLHQKTLGNLKKISVILPPLEAL